MPVLPDDGSRIVAPGCSRPSASASSIIFERDAILRRTARVLTFELGPDADVGVRRQRVHTDERRVADQPEDVVEPRTRVTQPPATAGRIESTSPSATLVSRPVEVADVVVVLVDVDELVQPAAVVEQVAAQARVPLDQRAEHLADGRAVDADGRLAVGVGTQDGRKLHLDGHGEPFVTSGTASQATTGPVPVRIPSAALGSQCGPALPAR